MIGTATATIPPPRNARTLVKEQYRTGDIVQLVQKVVRTNVKDTERFARRFPPTRAGLKALFNWVDKHFRYKEDPPGSQWVQTPAWLNKYRVGDCKSFSAFISTVLTNMGVDHIIRYAAYRPGDLRHVYVVAILDGEEIPMDVVWKKQEGGTFGNEKWPQRTKDFRMKGLAQLGSAISGQDYIGKLETDLADIRRAARNIPDTVNKGWGDVTKMTKGEVDRMIFADRYIIQANQSTGEKSKRYQDAARAMKNASLAGIGSLRNDPLGDEVQAVLRSSARKTEPAFKPFTVAVPAMPPLSQIDGFFDGIFKKAKKIGQKIVKAVGDVFKKFVNWVFKGAAMAMGPFFIFKFLQKRKIKSKKILTRIESQDRTYNFIQRVGKFDDNQLKGVMLNGILKNTGKSPAQMAADAGVPKIGAAPLIPVIMKAITFVVEVVGKVASIFKKNKNEGGVVDQTTMSDPRLFEEEARLQAAANGPASSPGGVSPLVLAAGIPLAIKFLI